MEQKATLQNFIAVTDDVRSFPAARVLAEAPVRSDRWLLGKCIGFACRKAAQTSKPWYVINVERGKEVVSKLPADYYYAWYLEARLEGDNVIATDYVYTD